MEEVGAKEDPGVQAVPQPTQSTTGALEDDMAAIRSKHQAEYLARERAAERQEQEQADAELARHIVDEDQRRLQDQQAEDQEYTRQLMERYNPDSNMAPVDRPVSGPAEDGTRSPLRTNYVDRLIDDGYLEEMPLPLTTSQFYESHRGGAVQQRSPLSFFQWFFRGSRSSASSSMGRGEPSSRQMVPLSDAQASFQESLLEDNTGTSGWLLPPPDLALAGAAAEATSVRQPLLFRALARLVSTPRDSSNGWSCFGYCWCTPRLSLAMFMVIALGLWLTLRI